ncbi:phosphotransferase enzyme family protein [Promicromonospora sp. NPDC090134]|uniref:phosphotransferase enzyme family protein n=1 Tax=Promicromonospora sp. NPDC090134 TaxID=3364408 RepID=UPI003827B55B
MDAHALDEALRNHWGLDATTVTTIDGGMNSRTWLVRAGDASYVAKRVSAADVELLATGCSVAERLGRAGLTTGRPVRTVLGALVAPDERLALLEHVPGSELGGTTVEEQRWIGATLAQVHHAGAPARQGPGTTGFFGWLTADAPGVRNHPWLPRAVDTARGATDRLTVTWSVLHTDPAPEAFRYDAAADAVGLIDWTGACRGPVLYDVASAVMYLGGPERAGAFLDAYSAAGPLDASELRHLDAFRRFRFAVRAAYFARRLTERDLTGIRDQRDNENGLEDARRGLERLATPASGEPK